MSEIVRKRSGLGRIGTIFACGAALFSDGYVNASAGAARYILGKIPGYTEAQPAHFAETFSALVFAGTIVGMLAFGYISDRVGRKVGMVFASMWLALWSVISGLAWGGGGSIKGMFQALMAYRFLLGLAIGAEYPAGSVAAAENTEDPGVSKGAQQKLLILATNSMIDLGFVLAYFIPYLLIQIFGDDHLEWVWRVTLGFGAVPPLLVLYFRMQMEEPERYRKDTMRGLKLSEYPWWLIIKRYWHRVAAISLVWWIYDWVSYPTGLYSNVIVARVLPEDASISSNLGWSTLMNFFYLPGTIAGALVSDRLGPKWTMIAGLLVQSILGFGLAGGYSKVLENVAGFTVFYGFYLTFGEFGPGNNLGLLAAKVSGPTAVRGIFYSICAAIGKVGAFVGTYVYQPIIDKYSAQSPTLGYQVPVYIGSALSLLAAVATLFFIPNPTPDGMIEEDRKFREYLEAHGYDTSRMGLILADTDPEATTDSAEKTPTVEPVIKDSPSEQSSVH